VDEFGERDRHPQRRWQVNTDFVVAAANVLDEGVSGDDGLCGAVGAQP